MSGMQISVSADALERVQKILAGVPDGARKALHNAISRGQGKVRTETVESISRVYAITQKDIRAGTNIRSAIKSAGDAVIGEVTFAGGKIPLYRYGVAPKVPTYQQRKIPVNIGGVWKTVSASQAVSAIIKRGGAKTTSQTAFIAQMDSGHIGVFERDGVSGKIHERMGLSTATMAENSIVLADVEREAQETVDKRLEHEITRILNGYGA